MTAPSAGVLAFNDVVAFRGERRILDGISFEVPEHRVTVVAGPSGAGKTTLLRLCNRLDVPKGGHIFYRGIDIATVDPMNLRRRVGIVFQRPVIFPGTVQDNLTVAAPQATRERCRSILEQVSLSLDLLGRQAGTLSGGEAQRLCLARTLLAEPDVLLADEPTSALDPGARLDFESLTRKLLGEGLTVLWVTHDLDQLRRLADRVLFLLDGRIRFEGSPENFGHSPELQGYLSGKTDGTD